MTPENFYSTLKTLVLASPTATALMAAADDQGLANWLNAPATPTFVVYRTLVSKAEIQHQQSPTGTYFSWTAGAYITRSQGERDAFREIFDSYANVNPSLLNVRAAFADIFSGAGGAANRAHIDAVIRRTATRAERAFATGAGVTNDPGLLVYEGSLSPGEASQVRVA